MTSDRSKQIILEAAPEQLASQFLYEFFARGNYARDVLARLIEMAVSEDRQIAESASRAIFASLVEQLCDSFEPDSVTLYNRLFAQLIEHCRTTRQGREIDRRLNEFHLNSEEDLVARAEKLRSAQSYSWLRSAKQTLRRVVVLSRVTLGADVAITSVMIERVKREFPDAEIVLVGGRKAAELFGGERRLAFKEVSYCRAGTVIERLMNWLDVLVRVGESINGLKRGQYLIVDPDSRLTQLGLLPLTHNEGDYLFFPSREYGSGASSALGKLTAEWLDEVFDESLIIYPQVYLGRADLETASEVVKRMRAGNRRPVVTINFGVGENPSKRVGDYFETSLVSSLIKDGAMIILDKGAGEEEARRAARVIKQAKATSFDGHTARVVETDEQALAQLLASDALDRDALVWSGRIGLLAAFISQSDLYIGYDSAGQHIAAAAGVPCIDVFAGHTSPRMLDRWRPTGKAETRVVAVDRSQGESEILSSALRYAGRMLARIRRNSH